MGPGEWFRAVIQETRRLEAAFDPDDLKLVRGLRLLDFAAPCQVRVFHIVEPTAYYVLICRVPTGPDADVWVSRPLHLHELLAALEKVAKEPLWDAPLPSTEHVFLQPGEEATFRSVVEQAFVHAIHHAERLPFIKPRDMDLAMGSSLAGEGASVWFGSMLAQQDPREYAAQQMSGIAQEIENAKARHAEAAARPALPSEPAPPGPSPREKYPGWGVWLYPRARIGPRPKGTLWDRMNAGSFALHEIAYVAEIALSPTKTLVATHDGFVGIHEADDTKRRRLSFEVEDHLNALAYCLNECGIDSYVVLEGELVGFEWSTTDGGRRISRRMMPYTYRTTASPIEEMFLGDIPLVSIKDFEQIVREAERVMKADRLRQARLVVEAATHLRRGHPTESFFHSWLLVEHLVSEDWRTYTLREDMDEKRRDRLRDDYNRWNIDTKLEVLDLAGALRLDFARAMKLKKPRNGILHGERRATRDEAKEALGLARSSLAARLSLKLPAQERSQPA